MPKRDFAQIAFDVVQRATGAVPPPPEPKASAVKGGQVRAANLSSVKRKAIAKKAAKARWSKE
jgi:hypothetical protein